MSRIQRVKKVAAALITKAGGGLEIVGNEILIKAEGVTNAMIVAAAGIPESKLSTPEMVKKAGEQTITGRKLFNTSGELPTIRIGTEGKKISTGVKRWVQIGEGPWEMEGTLPLLEVITANAEVKYVVNPSSTVAASFFTNQLRMKALTASATTMAPVMSLRALPTLEGSKTQNTTGWGSFALHHKPSLSSQEPGITAAATELVGLLHEGTINGGWTVSQYGGVHVQDAPGAGTITESYGLKVEDLKKATSNYSVTSLGTEVKLKNEGPIEGGSTLKVKEGSTLEGAVKAEKTLEVKELLTAKGGATLEGTVKLPTESLETGEIKAEAITFPKLAQFSHVAPIEIAAGKTYEVPENIQGLWKESISIQGTLNLQGRFDEVGTPETIPNTMLAGEIEGGKLLNETITFPKLGLFSSVAPLEVVAGKTYEVPENIQGLWKENLSVQGTLNVQGRYDEVGVTESSPWILPAPVAPTNNVLIPLNTQTWFKLSTAVEGTINLQGQLAEVE